MPELPEVETIRLQLTSVLIGQTIREIEILKLKSFQGDYRKIKNRKIIFIKRYAKILVINLSGELSLAIHLKMTGQLIYRGKKQPAGLKVTDKDLQILPNKFTRVIFHFISGDTLYFNDMRIFGWVKMVRKQITDNREQTTDNRKQNKDHEIPYLNDLIKNYGPEPFKDLNLDNFSAMLKKNRRPIKIILMDQQKIAGVGNIYANDALFLAGIHPKTPAQKISPAQTYTLYHKLLKVLKDGIKWKGASQDNYRDAFGRMGEAQEHFYVYAKDKKICSNKCGGVIEKIKLGGRGTFYCPICQK